MHLRRESESEFLAVRGLRYHVRRWRADGAPKVMLLHGWMDVSASFQFLVDAFARDWDVYAPDWRGYGMTEWGKADSYWFPDYLADLEVLLSSFSCENLVGHSLGGNVATVYAGVRPERIRKVVNLEGFGMAPTRAELAPKRYARWLDELADRPRLRPYENFAALASRLQQGNPRLGREKAEFLARHWGKEIEGAVVLRSDPAHKIVNPVLYRYEEIRACWSAVKAPVLWVEGAESETPKRLGIDPSERRAAFADLHFKTIAGAGHMLHHDQPGALAKVIEDFLR